MSFVQTHTFTPNQQMDKNNASWLNTPMRNVSFGTFLVAIILYALLGNPTPDIIGTTEIGIASLLILAIGAQGVHVCLDYKNLRQKPIWFQIGWFVFLSLSIAGIIQYTAFGHALHDAVRDFIALVFLFLPLLVYGMFKYNHERYRSLLYVLLFAGIVFALRGLSVFADFNIFRLLDRDPLFYLANSPLVLFCSIFLMAQAWLSLTHKKTTNGKLLAITIFALALIPFAAMALTVQRASLALGVLGFGILVVRSMYNVPYRSMFGLSLLVLAGLLLWPALQEILMAFDMKNQLAGDNMRLAELAAIWGRISATPFTLLFGTGFGGNFQSPAVGGYTVNFAHGLLSATLLKSGIWGVILVSLYMGALARVLLITAKQKLSLVLSLLMPFLISIFLYANYKSFDFGLLLVLIAFSSLVRNQTSRNSH